MSLDLWLVCLEIFEIFMICNDAYAFFIMCIMNALNDKCLES